MQSLAGLPGALERRRAQLVISDINATALEGLRREITCMGAACVKAGSASGDFS